MPPTVTNTPKLCAVRYKELNPHSLDSPLTVQGVLAFENDARFLGGTYLFDFPIVDDMVESWVRSPGKRRPDQIRQAQQKPMLVDIVSSWSGIQVRPL